MRRLALTGLALAALAATTSSSASAQAYNMLNVRAGMWLPVDSTVRDISTIWMGFGLDYHIHSRLLGDSDTVISADYLGHSLGATKGSIFPITLNQYIYQDFGLERMYIGIGAGAMVADVSGPAKTVFGLKATFGLELTEEWSVETSYFWSDVYDEVNDARVNGIGFYLGYRF